MSRLLKIRGLFCKRALYKRLYSAKETYYLKEATNGSHHIWQGIRSFSLVISLSHTQHTHNTHTHTHTTHIHAHTRGAAAEGVMSYCVLSHVTIMIWGGYDWYAP